MTDPAMIASGAGRHRGRASLGPPDVLANNAGISGPNFPLPEYPPEEWRRVMEIDRVFNCCRAVIPAMQRRDYGRSVNIALIAGEEGDPGQLCDPGRRPKIFAQMTEPKIDNMLSKVPMGRFASRPG